MRASDLMLGDWVKSRGKIEQVREAYDGFISTDSFEDSHDYNFEPIPLTREILEKNGFDFERNAFKEDEHLALEIYIDDGIRWTINCYEYEILLLEYVHQLQHALKLCGIDKEIVL